MGHISLTAMAAPFKRIRSLQQLPERVQRRLDPHRRGGRLIGCVLLMPRAKVGSEEDRSMPS